MILTPEEELRYNRQIILKQIDFDGQEALKQSKVLIIGLGGLGCAAAQYLAAAGVGHLTLVDDDKVELSNLQRQLLHRDSRIGMWKVESATIELTNINPFIQLKAINKRLSNSALTQLLVEHNLVLDCTDNIETRNQINALCYQQKTPLVSGAAIRLEGQLSVFTYQKDEACYACLSHFFGEQVLSCVEAGVLSPVVGIIGTMQALEAIKLITKFSPVKTNTLTLFDASTSQWREFHLAKDPNCIVCNEQKTKVDTANI